MHVSNVGIISNNTGAIYNWHLQNHRFHIDIRFLQFEFIYLESINSFLVKGERKCYCFHDMTLLKHPYMQDFST